MWTGRATEKPEAGALNHDDDGEVENGSQVLPCTYIRVNANHGRVLVRVFPTQMVIAM